MTKKLKERIHWEVRRPKWHEGDKVPETRQFDFEPEARAHALTMALQGKKDCYTGQVHLVQIRTTEEYAEVFDDKSAAGFLLRRENQGDK